MSRNAGDDLAQRVVPGLEQLDQGRRGLLRRGADGREGLDRRLANLRVPGLEHREDRRHDLRRILPEPRDDLQRGDAHRGAFEQPLDGRRQLLMPAIARGEQVEARGLDVGVRGLQGGGRERDGLGGIGGRSSPAP